MHYSDFNWTSRFMYSTIVINKMHLPQANHVYLVMHVCVGD